MTTIDLNADLGEGDAYDAELLKLVSSCNIACGGHAGDAESIASTIREARELWAATEVTDHTLGELEVSLGRDSDAAIRTWAATGSSPPTAGSRAATPWSGIPTSPAATTTTGPIPSTAWPWLG